VLRIASPAAWAHEPFQIKTDVRVLPDGLTMQTLIDPMPAAVLCLPRGTDRKDVTAESLSGAGEALWTTCARSLYRVSTGETATATVAIEAEDLVISLTAERDVQINARYPRPTRGPLRIEAVHLKQLLDPQYGAEITATGIRSGSASGSGAAVFLGQQLLRADSPVFEIPLPEDATTAPDDPSRAPRVTGFAAYFHLGVHHILTGYDHLLFLLGLLLACRRWRAVLAIVSCFTIAHSLTLALAALGVVGVSGRWIEPLIAASIVFVGVENWLGVRANREPRGRAALTFAFGLIHGFGFASTLSGLGLGLPGGNLTSALVGFNLGVECGQLGVALLVLPLLKRLHASPRWDRPGTQALSLACAAMGLVWLVVRVAASFQITS